MIGNWLEFYQLYNEFLFLLSIQVLNGPRREKTCVRGSANNKGTEQPAHPRSLISPFVIRFLVSVMSKLVTSEFSRFQLVSVAEETEFESPFVRNPEDRFCHDVAQITLHSKG